MNIRTHRPQGTEGAYRAEELGAAGNMGDRGSAALGSS